MDRIPRPDGSLMRRHRSTGLAGFVAGVLGCGVALGFGELIHGLSETVPSLVIAVGEVMTDYTPGDVVAFSIANIGDSQKTVLTAGIAVVSLAVCGLLGRRAARGGRLAAVAGFALFGLVGGWAAARNPLSPAAVSWLVALAAAALGAATTLFLAGLASPLRRPVDGAAAAAGDGDDGDGEDAADGDGDGDSDSRTPERAGPRRSFFAYATGAAVTALSLVGLGRSLRGPSAAEQAREIYTLPPRDSDPAPDAAGSDPTADAGAGIEVPEGIGIPEGIDIPEGIAIPDEAPAVEEVLVEAPDEQSGSTDQADGSASTTQPPEQEPATTTQPPEQEPAATTTTEPPEEPEPATTTTTQPPEQEPAATTTTEPPEELEPATTTTTEPPEEPEPTTTTTEPPEEPEPATTTTRPASSSRHPQVAHLDTLDDEVAGISPYITPISPKSEFYRIDTALTVPQVDPDTWRLRITGLVDNPYELTYHDLRAMRLSDHVITLSCVSNIVGGRLVGNAVWTGIPLYELLQRAGVQRGAQQIVGRSVDDFTAGFPTTAAYDGRNAILAIGMNNEPLPIRHGFPARIVVAGLYGYVSAVKWLEEIHLTTWDGFDGYWVPRGWSKQGPMKTQSRIDLPKDGARVNSGETIPVAGIAWAPTRGIERVEVRIGDGDWTTCRLGQAAGNESWVQWHRDWTPSGGGRQQIQVRATDGSGYTQSERNVRPRPNGAEGWHTISVNVR